MPEKITNLANVSVSVIHFVGWIIGGFTIIGTLISGYAIFVVKTLYNKIDDVREGLNYEKSVHKEIFDKVNDAIIKIVKVETDLSNLRDDHDKNHGGKK